MKALVTGGGGFLGKVLCRRLVSEGRQVRAFDLPGVDMSGPKSLGVETVEGDLRNREDVNKACAGMDVVFHVAALASPWGPYRLFYDINVMGTMNVIDACRRYGVGRLVYTSSPSAIFDGTDQRGLDESVPYPVKYTSFYGKTKAMAERIVLDVVDHGLSSCAIRPHVIWGPGDNQLFPRILKRAKAGKLMIVGTGKNIIDVTNVEDAAHAHMLAAQSDKSAGKAYFVSQGKPVSLWGIVCRTIEQAGMKPPDKKVPYALARSAATAIELIWEALGRVGEPPLTRYMVDELARDHYYDISRARNDLGYEPEVTTETGFEPFVEWIKTELIPKL